MTTTETRPRTVAALAAARRERDQHALRLALLIYALDEAERGGATVVRIEHVRGIVGATAAELGGA